MANCRKKHAVRPGPSQNTPTTVLQKAPPRNRRKKHENEQP